MKVSSGRKSRSHVETDEAGSKWTRGFDISREGGGASVPRELSVKRGHHRILTHFGNRGSRIRFHEASENVSISWRGNVVTIVRDLSLYEAELGRALRERR